VHTGCQFAAVPAVKKRGVAFKSFVAVPVTVQPHVGVGIQHVGENCPGTVVALSHVPVSPGIFFGPCQKNFGALLL